MNYEEALEYIHSTYKFGSKLGLQNIGILLGLLGEPQNKLKFVHIAGTNGKGSTTAFLGSILKASGLKVGLYTSPFIQRFTERIRINNEEIPQERLAEIVLKIKCCINKMVEDGYNHPTEFEIVTALGLQYFFEEGCDIVILEVGLGGRFDATNIIDKPEVAIITSISFDHMDILGDTLPKIAFEKAGIIKPDCDCILYNQSNEVENTIKDICMERNARLINTDFTNIKNGDFTLDGQQFSYKNYQDLCIRLLGDHQTRNACMAIEACVILNKKGFKISEEHIREGLKSARWAGRLEIVSKDPIVLIDGAHNEDGARIMVDALKKYFPGYKITFIMGVLKDKEYTKLIKIASEVADKFIAVDVPSPRALEVNKLYEELAKYCKNVRKGDTIKGAVELAVSQWHTGEIICAFGSLYYIGEVREYFI